MLRIAWFDPYDSEGEIGNMLNGRTKLSEDMMAFSMDEMQNKYIICKKKITPGKQAPHET